MTIIKYKILPLLLLPFLLSNAQAALYKTIDKDGNITYSDSPAKNAKELELPPIPLIHIAPSPELGLSKKTSSNSGESMGAEYSQLMITFPRNGETTRSNSGDVAVALSINPVLSSTDTLVLKVNGIEMRRGHSELLTLPHLDRGSHTLQAFILNAANETLISSEPITFHLQRHSKVSN